ncbi:MAG: glutamine amidotransferase, partial [Gemmataceae bacterium]
EKLGDLNTRGVRDGLPRGTNLGDTLINLINKEMNNRLQGIVVFTDGRNTEGSPNAFRDLEARAKAARVPFFVVGVGEDRQKVKIEIVDLRAPQQIQPEDKFRVKTELTGEGLGGEKVEVAMEVSHVRIVKSKVKGPDGKLVEREVEEALPIELIETEDQDNPRSAREKINLGEKLILKPAGEVGFDKATPPRLEVEWQLDAAALATAGKIDLESGGFKAKKWEIAETRDDSELRFQVRVPVDKREGLREKFHESNKMGLKVIKKPLRVLLVAAAANRDYQFLRSLLLRETEKKRMELAIYLQLPPGETKRRPGVVQDVPPERLLSTFPDSFRTKKGDLYDLSSYDVIVAFDADWMQIQPDQIRLLRDWAEKGGGLVMVGGYINTVELIRPRDGEDAERFKPVHDLLPVVLDDRRDYIDRKTDDPWPLDFEGASPEMEFLKLDEELDETKFKEDWQAFFFGLGKERTEKPQRGFFSFYPVQRAKTGSLVIGRFADPSARLKDNSLHPYLVASPEALPRVVWLGSAESWRLREYRENYHERFWTKLLRYAAAKSKGPIIKSIRIESPTVVTSGRYMEVEARIDGPDGQPLDRNAKPTISVKLPPGVPESEIKQPISMIPRPGARDGWFSGRFLVRSAGEYEFTVKAPRQLGQESEQTESAKFIVKEANPEMDNTRPDFDRLYRLASEADEVMPRMATDGDRAELRRRLVRPRLQSPSTGEREDQTEIREDRIRLFFDLKNASLIPGCMVQDVQVQRSRGRYQDLWDDGFTLYEYPIDEESGKPTRPPIKLSYVLLLVVGLLSVEWLTRKLLRLA